MEVKVIEEFKKNELKTDFKEENRVQKEREGETENKVMNLHQMTSYMYVIRNSYVHLV